MDALQRREAECRLQHDETTAHGAAVGTTVPATIDRGTMDRDTVPARLDDIGEDGIHAATGAEAEVVEHGSIKVGRIMRGQPRHAPGGMRQRDGMAAGKGVALDERKPVQARS